jgi:4-azaleucine resistance transporter AzlC
VTGDARARFLAGVRLGAGPAAAVFVLALTFGAAARSAGWGELLPLLFSMFAFSGSAQFALLTTLPTGSAVASVVSAVMINARYIVMGVAINDSLRGGRLWRAVQAQVLADASFVIGHRGGGRFDILRLAGASLPQWLCWVGGTAVGLAVRPSPDLMHELGADVVFPAFFLLLAMDEAKHTRRAVAAAVVGGTIAAAVLAFTEPGYALLAATAGALVGAVSTREPEATGT